MKSIVVPQVHNILFNLSVMIAGSGVYRVRECVGHSQGKRNNETGNNEKGCCESSSQNGTGAA